VYQGRIHDGIATERDALLFVEHRPVRLSGIGLTIWQAAGEGVLPARLLSIVKERHGDHPQASMIVGEAVDRMLDAGVLVYRAGKRASTRATSP
jgi:hypothetical protein